LKGQDWLKSVGGSASDLASLQRNTKIAGDAYAYYAKKVVQSEKEIGAYESKPLLRSIQGDLNLKLLKDEVAADKVLRDRALDRFLTASAAARRKGELPVTNFQAPVTDGGGGEKEREAKKLVDMSLEEFNIRNQIRELESGMDPVRQAYLNYKLQILGIDEKEKNNQIGFRDAENQRRDATVQLNEAVNKEMDRMVQNQIELDRLTKQQTISLEDVKAQYGLITREAAEELKFKREIARLREGAKGTRLIEETEEVIRKLIEARERAKTFGAQLAVSFAEGIKSMGELSKNLGASLATAFGGLADVVAEFVATGKASFADFARSVLADLTKIFVRAAFFYTLKSILPGGGFLGKLLNFEKGGIMTDDGPMQLKRYANGGIANSPQLAMFGEGRTPEAYVPLPDGRSIPVTMQGGGQGVNVVVNVDAKSSAVEGEGANAKALGVAISSVVQSEIIKQQRPGGLLSGAR